MFSAVWKLITIWLPARLQKLLITALCGRWGTTWLVVHQFGVISGFDMIIGSLLNASVSYSITERLVSVSTISKLIVIHGFESVTIF